MRAAAACLAALLASGAAVAQSPPGAALAMPGRCYLADRPLRQAAEDTARLPMDRPAAWAWTIELAEAGRIRRGGAEDAWSQWRTSGDTLLLQLGSLAGWSLSLLPPSGGGDSLLAGIATYRTDVVVKDWRAPWTTVVLARRPCPRR